MIAYLLLTFSSVIAGFTLAKDWKNHGSSWRRTVVLLLIVIVWIMGIVNIHSTKKQNLADKEILNGRIDGLNRTITEGQKQAIGTISHLTDRVADLQTKVETADLKKQVTKLQQELIENQRAMAPPPKARLFFNVGGASPQYGQKPVLITSRAMNGDHLTLPFDVIVTPDADAIDGYFALQICDQCRFASEPKGWVKIDGDLETRRNFAFQRYLADSATETFTVDIVPPSGATQINVGLEYRCKTCLRIPLQTATISITR
jgi:hypothetical protein